MRDRLRVRVKQWFGADPDLSRWRKVQWAFSVVIWKFQRTHLAKLKGKGRSTLYVIGLVSFGVDVLSGIWFRPTLVDSRLYSQIPDAQRRLATLNDARTLALQAFLAFAGFVTVIYTARNYFLSKSGQVSDRLVRAAENLSSDSRIRRVSGIHAISRLLQDSSSDHAGLIDILSTFVRESARLEPTVDREEPYEELDGPDDYEYMWDQQRGQVPIDLQAALHALTERPRRFERPWIILGMIQLIGASLNHRNISNLHFEGSDLRGVDFAGARARFYVLASCDVRGANFSGANLISGHFQDADARYAYFRRTDLSGSGLSGTDSATAYSRMSC